MIAPDAWHPRRVPAGIESWLGLGWTNPQLGGDSVTHIQGSEW